MKLVELSALSPGVHVWLEQHTGVKHSREVVPVIVKKLRNDSIWLQSDYPGTYVGNTYTVDYNVPGCWRCWDEEPTTAIMDATPWLTNEELLVGPEGKTCGTCYRRKWKARGCYNCCACGSPRKIEEFTADAPACRFYYDQKEEWKRQAEDRKRQEDYKKRMQKRAVMSPPVLAEWMRWSDPMSDYVSPPMPRCPICETDLWELRETCEFCGVRIINDVRLKSFFKTPKILSMDCPHCKGKGSFKYTRSILNNHLHGRCDACGMSMME